METKKLTTEQLIDKLMFEYREGIGWVTEEKLLQDIEMINGETPDVYQFLEIRNTLEMELDAIYSEHGTTVKSIDEQEDVDIWEDAGYLRKY